MQELILEHAVAPILKKKNRWVSILANSLFAVGCMVAAYVLSEFLFFRNVRNESIILVYILSLFLISVLTTGYAYSIISAIISSLAYDYFISFPRYGFSFLVTFPVTLILMTFVTIISCVMMSQLKLRMTKAKEEENRNRDFHDVSQIILLARDIVSIARAANRFLLDNLGRSVCFYTLSPDDFASSYCTQADKDIAMGVFDTRDERVIGTEAYTTRKICGNRTQYSPLSPIQYWPIEADGKALGVLAISCHNGEITADEQISIQFIINQVALALELYWMSEKQVQSELATEKEKMRSSLLRSMSHDLRTPLTSIWGASVAILDDTKPLDRETIIGLVADIQESSEWLIKLIENLLLVTRINNETLQVKKHVEAAEEVVIEALSIVKKSYPERSINVRIPDELLLVPMDAILISQVLVNLLENAIKNSAGDTLIFVNLRQEQDYALFEISDNGRGISDQMMRHLFTPLTDIDDWVKDAMTGTGVGLSICKAIVTAHGGKIEGKNKETGGAKFSFWLPMMEEKNA